MDTPTEQTIQLPTVQESLLLFGNHDENLQLIEEQFKVKLVARGGQLSITGEEERVNKVVALFNHLIELVRQGHLLGCQEINYAIRLAQDDSLHKLPELFADIVFITSRGKHVKAKTLGQKQYIHALRKYDIVFGIGPAGTGKTYLAVAMAVEALKNKRVNRIILTRPAVEAGEKLGFLPGDLQEKIDPYLRPLYDALYDMMGAETTQKYLEKGYIEIAPLAYMRGRTLDDSYIILDEAQNTTPEQMKMFLTRLGFGSRIVVTGDVTQIDLSRNQYSGLVEVQKILKGIEGISFQYLTEADIVRHSLVQKIIRAYDQYGEKVSK